MYLVSATTRAVSVHPAERRPPDRSVLGFAPVARNGTLQVTLRQWMNNGQTDGYTADIHSHIEYGLTYAHHGPSRSRTRGESEGSERSYRRDPDGDD